MLPRARNGPTFEREISSECPALVGIFTAHIRHAATLKLCKRHNQANGVASFRRQVLRVLPITVPNLRQTSLLFRVTARGDVFMSYFC
jgi:hypothetical protein